MAIDKIINLNKVTGSTDKNGNRVNRKVFEVHETIVEKRTTKVTTESLKRRREELVKHGKAITKNISDIDEVLAQIED